MWAGQVPQRRVGWLLGVTNQDDLRGPRQRRRRRCQEASRE